jgi:arginine N-succinyltransferase
MIIIRSVSKNDTSALEKLSKIASESHPGFLNVPQDADAWADKISYSEKSFSGKLEKGAVRKFIFVAEDTKTNQVLGVSMLTSQHGTKESPHFYFQVGHEQKFSQTINTGFIHGTLVLHIDHDGPTEIGGLLVDPEARNHPEKVGRQVSFARFLYVAMNRGVFKDKILAELLPPLTKKGKSPLWEAVGRRFTNMDYWEADYLSAKNKEFILSLFPSGVIYVTFLPAEARNAVGKVSKHTEPVMHMLKKIGFQYQHQVDPFDGGPHLVARTDDITPIRNHRVLIYGGSLLSGAQTTEGLLCSAEQSDFKAAAVSADIVEGKLYCSEDRANALGIRVGDSVHFSPFY